MNEMRAGSDPGSGAEDGETDMRTVSTKSLALFASCVALLLPGPSGAQNHIDLDQLTHDQLEYALNAELDDVYEALQSNGEYDLDVIFDVIMHALSDANDDHGEQTVSHANLTREMHEAGLSLEGVVRDALELADQYSENGSEKIIRVRRKGSTRPDVAVQQTKADLKNAVTGAP